MAEEKKDHPLTMKGDSVADYAKWHQMYSGNEDFQIEYKGRQNAEEALHKHALESHILKTLGKDDYGGVDKTTNAPKLRSLKGLDDIKKHKIAKDIADAILGYALPQSKRDYNGVLNGKGMDPDKAKEYVKEMKGNRTLLDTHLQSHAGLRNGYSDLLTLIKSSDDFLVDLQNPESELSKALDSYAGSLNKYSEHMSNLNKVLGDEHNIVDLLPIGNKLAGDHKHRFKKTAKPKHVVDYIGRRARLGSSKDIKLTKAMKEYLEPIPDAA